MLHAGGKQKFFCTLVLTKVGAWDAHICGCFLLPLSLKIQVEAMSFLPPHALPKTMATMFVGENLVIFVMFALGKSKACMLSAFCLQELQSSTFCGLSMLMNSIMKMLVNVMSSFCLAQILRQRSSPKQFKKHSNVSLSFCLSHTLQ